jgi:hypothetical protein
MRNILNQLRPQSHSENLSVSIASTDRRWIFLSLRTLVWIFLILVSAAVFSLGIFPRHVAAQQLDTPTPSPSTSAYITVTYIEPINVRLGPGSFDYPIIGSLPVGGTAVAVGRSPAGEWIQIVYADAPRGTGWVYAANVSLSADVRLPIVEPPPTLTPEVTPTLNQTFAAAFQIQPTATRKPTFTAPPPLVVPTYTNPADAPSRSVTLVWIFAGLGLLGIVGLILSSFRRR